MFRRRFQAEGREGKTKDGKENRSGSEYPEDKSCFPSLPSLFLPDLPLKNHPLAPGDTAFNPLSSVSSVNPLCPLCFQFGLCARETFHHARALISTQLFSASVTSASSASSDAHANAAANWYSL